MSNETIVISLKKNDAMQARQTLEVAGRAVTPGGWLECRPLELMVV